ncbi:hypothetical protein [uncultured Campylobacter sp.]|uniref:hypothetical protein n=1 Tax=uncultured Campylobacter sp. TaxID=218934 RepID=UPI0026034AB2|nr:hypothetical protein [uncultured Campylobacter sp.]
MGYLISDRLIDIWLILFFGGFGFVCYINGVCGIGKDYMQRNKIDFVRWTEAHFALQHAV